MNKSKRREQERGQYLAAGEAPAVASVTKTERQRMTDWLRKRGLMMNARQFNMRTTNPA